jgi:hypothetical protein
MGHKEENVTAPDTENQFEVTKTGSYCAELAQLQNCAHVEYKHQEQSATPLKALKRDLQRDVKN